MSAPAATEASPAPTGEQPFKATEQTAPTERPAPFQHSRLANPTPTWPAVLVEGDPDQLQNTALTLAHDERIGEVLWIDWASGWGDQWCDGTGIRLIDRPHPPDDWGKQLRMIDHIARYARSYLDATGVPIAVVIDSVTDLYAEQRRWARCVTNNVPKIKYALRQHPGLPVTIDGQVWDEIDDRISHFMQAINAIPGITVLLASGSLRATDKEGTALAVPEYHVSAHRLIPRRVHAHLRVDDTGAAYPRRVPPLWRDHIDREAPIDLGTLVFDVLGLDPATATHHTGL